MYLLHLQKEHQQLRLCNSEGKVQQLLIAVQTDHPVLCTYLRSRCSLLHLQITTSSCVPATQRVKPQLSLPSFKEPRSYTHRQQQRNHSTHLAFDHTVLMVEPLSPEVNVASYIYPSNPCREPPPGTFHLTHWMSQKLDASLSCHHRVVVGSSSRLFVVDCGRPGWQAAVWSSSSWSVVGCCPLPGLVEGSLGRPLLRISGCGILSSRPVVGSRGLFFIPIRGRRHHDVQTGGGCRGLLFLHISGLRHPDVKTSGMQSRPRLHPDSRSATSCRSDQWEAFATSSSSRSAVCGILTSSPVVDSRDLFFLQISVLRHLIVQWEAVTASSSSRSAVCDNLSSSPLAASRGLLFLRNRGMRHPVNSAVLSNIRVYFSGFCCPSWVSMLPTIRSFSL